LHPESYAYQYLVGGSIFTLGAWLCIRNGDLRTDVPEERRWLLYSVLGLLACAAVQGFFQFVAVKL
jgi:hypothetical protein